MATKTRTKKTVPRKQQWFTPIRGSYLPKSWQGMSIYFTYMLYNIALPVTWYRKGHELWALVTIVLPLMAASVLLTQYIASRNSK